MSRREGPGEQLLTRVSTANAARHGVTIAAEALIDGEHRLILIVAAGDDKAVERVLGFLRQCGDLHVMAASTAEAAVERGGCDVPPKDKPDDPTASSSTFTPTIRRDTPWR